jgi:membrane protein required for colicin V production
MVFDIFFLVFVSIGFWWGYQKGIIYSLFSLAAYFLGIIAALKFSFAAVLLLQGSVNLGPRAISILAFVLVFVLVVLLVRLVAWGLERILQSFSLNLPNRIIGGLLHAVIGMYILCVFVWFLNKWDIISLDQKRDSHVYSYVADLGPVVVELSGRAVPYFKDAFANFEHIIHESHPANR